MIRINRLNNIINHATNNIKEKPESKGLSQKIGHIHNFLTAVLWILQLTKKPFDMLDTDAERSRIEALFKEENGEII